MRFNWKIIRGLNINDFDQGVGQCETGKSINFQLAKVYIKWHYNLHTMLAVLLKLEMAQILWTKLIFNPKRFWTAFLWKIFELNKYLSKSMHEYDNLRLFYSMSSEYCTDYARLKVSLRNRVQYSHGRRRRSNWIFQYLIYSNKYFIIVLNHAGFNLSLLYISRMLILYYS